MRSSSVGGLLKFAEIKDEIITLKYMFVLLTSVDGVTLQRKA